MTQTAQDLKDLALDSAGIGIFTVDAECRVTWWNAAAERITGRSSGEMIGRRCCDLERTDCLSGDIDKDGRCSLFHGADTHSAECLVERPDGRSVRVLRTARLLRDDGGGVLGAVETITDLSPLAPENRRPIDLPRILDENSPVPGMIGESEAMQQTYRMIRFAADSESTVLITGESGTGKEMAARAIHRLGKRSEGPFVAVNCSALPESLLESELFGHVRGAFTGAVANKVGRIELAAEGTIFLDEIGDISPLIQLKLLRFLQDQEYQRVGESASRKARVRVITATNRDLYSLVRKGEFREDLFFRLKVFPINIPPLRERKSDIPALLNHFIGRFNRKTGKNLLRVHPEAMRLMLDYCWPGNVRELEHAVEYAFVLCQTEELSPYELPQEFLLMEYRRQFCPQGETVAPEGNSAKSVPGSTGERSEHLKLSERDRLLSTLRRTGWNRTEAARLLGVSRVTIWKRMKKLGINPAEN